MLLTVCDDLFRYKIEAPDDSAVLLNHGGFDYLVVPDPEQPGVPYWLFDEFLVEAARCGDFGLRLVGEEPLVGTN
jgi:hypothetical protein